jgi:hypothetical protein
MWRCPQCNENIEDQFDSCWKCAAAVTQEPPPDDSFIVWLNPVVSLLTAIAFAFCSGFFWHQRGFESDYSNFGGALFGTAMSGVAIWAFLRCPWRHWFVKLLTLLFSLPSLASGIIMVGSFVIQEFGLYTR